MGGKREHLSRQLRWVGRAELLINPGDRRGIALDVAGGKMYWTDGFDGIGMANLDGSNVRNFDTPDFTMGDVTLDLSNGRMYWVDGEGSELRRGNLNGSQQQTILNLRIYDIALYTPVVETEPPVKAYPAWDVNEDGKTDITDLVLVAAALGTSPPDNPAPMLMEMALSISKTSSLLRHTSVNPRLLRHPSLLRCQNVSPPKHFSRCWISCGGKTMDPLPSNAQLQTWSSFWHHYCPKRQHC